MIAIVAIGHLPDGTAPTRMIAIVAIGHWRDGIAPTRTIAKESIDHCLEPNVYVLIYIYFPGWTVTLRNCAVLVCICSFT